MTQAITLDWDVEDNQPTRAITRLTWDDEPKQRQPMRLDFDE